MKILRQVNPANRNNGCCWLDPVNLPTLLQGCLSRVTRDGFGVAGIVVTSSHLIASSIECDDHLSMAEDAGLELDEAEPFEGKADGDLRGFATAAELIVEFWRPELDDVADDQLSVKPTIDLAVLDRVLSFLHNHPKVYLAYNSRLPVISVSIISYGGGPEWIYRAGFSDLVLATGLDASSSDQKEAMAIEV